MQVQIIGAGQLGSRHLQALKNYNKELEIVVVDKSVESLRVAKERYDSLATNINHKIQFSEVPLKGKYDLLIVASNASERRKIIENFLEHSQAKNIVLEKILFTKESDYTWAATLADTELKNAWVNCCMRQMPIYQQIKNELPSDKFTMTVTGSNFGLITNAIHYVDYACYLANSNDFQIETDKLISPVIESKRKGYLEYNGVLNAKFKNGSVLTITCFPDGSLPIAVEVHNANKRFVVLESERKALTWDQKNEWKCQEQDAIIPYQSQLTTELVKEFADGGTCVLPTLKDSLAIHLNLLNPLKKHLQSTGESSAIDYPFT